MKAPKVTGDTTLGQLAEVLKQFPKNTSLEVNLGKDGWVVELRSYIMIGPVNATSIAKSISHAKTLQEALDQAVVSHIIRLMGTGEVT